MKKTVRMLALLLALLFALSACGGNGGSSSESAAPSAEAESTDSSAAPEKESDAPAGEAKQTTDGGDKFVIGVNNYSKGNYSVDILEKNFVLACEVMGVDTMAVNDEAKVENSVKNVDAMIASGVDAVAFFGISDTLFPVVAQKCEDAGIPFAFFDHMPTDDVLNQLKGFEHYLGIAATVDFNTGREAAEYALSQGCSKAIVVTGLTTDTTHSARTNGFAEAFTAGGGTVLAEGYGETTIAQAMTRANDLLTAHPDTDFVYATNGNVGSACIEALAKHTNIDAVLYVTDLDPDVLTGLKNGTVGAANGAHWVNVYYTAALIVNHLEGNTIKDANGEPPRLVVPVMTLPGNLVGLYDKCWINNMPYTPDELRAFVGPDVTIDVLQEALDKYTITNRLEALVEQGVLTQAELDEAMAA